MKEDLDFSIGFKNSRKRKETDNRLYIIGGMLFGIILIIIVVVWGLSYKAAKKATGSDAGKKATNTDAATNSEAKKKEGPDEEEINAIFAEYQDFGLVKLSEGYLNIRKEAGKNKDVIGKLYDGSAVSIMESINDEEGTAWLHVKSGMVEGYTVADKIITGEEAKKEALSYIKKRAIIKTEKLRVRKEANENSEVIDVVEEGERYEVMEELDKWVLINLGYISKDYVEIKYALNEARKLDLKSMVLNEYEKLGMSFASGYVNIRKEPKTDTDSNIIGKLPNGAAAEILEALDGWYKIKSGPVTGYVSSDYIKTGDEAKDMALEKAELMAVVKEPVLNVRTEPNTDSKIWTQITNAEKYPVVQQLDGWVEIELEDDNNTYVSTQYVDVRYALNEAVKFNPMSGSEGSKVNSVRSQVVNYALQFLGNPYVWGGTSLTKGCDCSGFTMQVLGKYGYGLPHYSGSQSTMGKKIDSSQMKPGDLIFYANSSGRINHVSMYIGNGQVVHAASRRSGIKISAWNYRRPVTIRNIIGD